jgi:hypothetical protein
MLYEHSPCEDIEVSHLDWIFYSPSVWAPLVLWGNVDMSCTVVLKLHSNVVHDKLLLQICMRIDSCTIWNANPVDVAQGSGPQFR